MHVVQITVRPSIIDHSSSTCLSDVRAADQSIARMINTRSFREYCQGIYSFIFTSLPMIYYISNTSDAVETFHLLHEFLLNPGYHPENIKWILVVKFGSEPVAGSG